MFPGERPATREELADPRWVENAFPTLVEQTNLPLSEIAFSFVHTAASGGAAYLVARPIIITRTIGSAQTPNPDQWWIFDEDVDETEGWIPFAVFTPDGYIDHGVDDVDDGSIHYEDRPPVFARPESPPSPPRDPNAPVTVSIDLDDHEEARREGVPAWEEHGHYGVLMNENGFAVVVEFAGCGSAAHGIVRYPDRTACMVEGRNTAEARLQAEKFLANKPYKNAYERVLGGPDFDDEPVPAVPETQKSGSVEAPAPRPQPVEKRVWGSIPIDSAEDDD